jgi:hypothetical protein
MSLLDLQAALQRGADANSGIVTVNAALLSGASLNPREQFDALLATGLRQPMGLPVTLSAKVPAPANGSLTLAGTVSLVGLKSVPATLTFRQQPENGPVDLQVELPLGDGWKFARSFPLATGHPFDDLSLDGAYYVFTTVPQGGEFAWQNKTILLAPGLNHVASLGLGGTFGVLSELVRELTGAVTVCGSVDLSAIAIDGTGLPLLQLDATLTGAVNALPSYFPLANPRVRLSTLRDENGALRPSLSFVVSLQVDGNSLGDLQTALFPGWSRLGFFLIPIKPVTPETIIKLLAGKDFTKAIPADLEKVFEAVGLRSIALMVSASPVVVETISATIGSTSPWQMGQFNVKDVALRYTLKDPFGLKRSQFYFEAKAEFFPDVFKGEFDLEIQYDVASGDMQVAGGFLGSVSLSDVVKGLSDGAVDLADIGFDLTLEDFGAVFTRAEQSKWEYMLHGKALAAFSLPLVGGKVEASLSLAVDSAAKTHRLVGGLTIGPAVFEVVADLGADRKVLSASWQPLDPAETLGFNTLITALGLDVPALPDGLDLDLTFVEFDYDLGNTVLTLKADSRSYGKTVLAARKAPAPTGAAQSTSPTSANESKWQFFFAIGVNRTINLTNLPLVNTMLGDAETIQLDQIQLLASSALDATGAQQINGLIDTTLDGAPVSSSIRYPKVPDAGLPEGAGLSLTFDAGGQKTPLHLGTGSTAPQSNEQKVTSMAPTDAPSTPAQTQTASGSDSTKWFTIQKSFGPVSIQKVGVRYQDSQLWALIDASLDAGGLTIALHGLGMGSALKSFDPKFTVSGIDVTLVEGPIEASGGLIGTIDPVNLYGELMLKTPEFALGALAGFAMVDDHPSFFLYATLLSPPLGGPAFFYVTGLAAGIGFNRKLVIPAVDGVATFPFIEWAMGSAPTSVPGGDTGQQVKDVLSTLASSGVVAPQVGEYWLAAGVHFTSFELVESFALITVKFGADFEVDLLGLSRLTLPPTGTPVVLIEIQLKASFSPSAGLLAISGQLSSRSYVLSESCHLTGGFAFYSWFSGEHEGDFVISMGGYSPRFDVPKHYPVVPRLGLRWQVTDQLTISGDEYFALTSSAVMAGGGLSAVWDGGPLSAWFSVEVDFLLIYQPFHYYLSASCQLGASFSIDLWFTTITITIHLGVGIEIWGPEFTGVATVDLSIISFSIEFGSSNQDASQKIEWHEFLDRLLPKKPAPAPETKQSRTARHIAAAAATLAVDPIKDPGVDATVVQIKMTNGLLKTLSETGEETLNYIVDSQHFEMEVSAIPSKDALFPQNPRAGFKTAPIDLPDKLQPTDKQGKIIQPNTLFGVGPVGLAPGDYTATLTVEIDSSADVKFHAVRIMKNVSKAFWEKPDFSGDGKSVPKLDPLNDTTIKNVLVGFQIIPFVTPPDQTRPIDLEYLKYTVDEEHIESFRWSAPIVPGADNFSTETVAGTLDDPNHAAKNRPALLRAIKGAGFAVAQTLDAGDLGDVAKTYLGDAPVLALLGEAK